MTRDSSHEGGKRGLFASRGNIVLVGFFILGGFYLLAEHRAHLWLVLPGCHGYCFSPALQCTCSCITGNHGGHNHTSMPAPGPEDKP